MTDTQHSQPRPLDREPLTTKNRIGLALAGVLGIMDTASFFGGPGSDSDDQGPPLGVMIAGGVLGVITLIAVVYAWRTAARTGSRIAAATRILSAITSLPAFFVDGIAAGLMVVVAVLIVLTAVSVALTLSRQAPDTAAADATEA